MNIRTTPKRWRVWALALMAFLSLDRALGQDFQVTNREGLRMSIDKADSDPAVHVVVPGGPEAERSFNILLPEHVTVREHDHSDPKHLYIYQPCLGGKFPGWKQKDNWLEYTKELSGIRFSARATLEDDGILFHYEFENRSETEYDMVWAVTDPRFKTFFYDPRLERTYVHHGDGFELLASETPARLTMPLNRWFPARYLAQFTAPIPEHRVQHRSDGITYYYKSRVVDLPLIATVSVDHQWIAASFTRDAGNVWSNPELTCQHVDPQVALSKGETAFYEVKLLIFRGSLEKARSKMLTERPGLKASPPKP